MTTKQYTAEDFAEASFARNPAGGIAARLGCQTRRPWRTEADWLSDAEMADRGWVPVRETAMTDNDGRVERLKRQIAEQDITITFRNAEIHRLRAEVKAAAQPITLDALHEAWENAEDADERNEGGILIYRNPADSNGMVVVWASEKPGPIGPHTRILHRAPKPKRPEGAEELEVLIRKLEKETAGKAKHVENVEGLVADWLAERGVRVVEGGK